MYHAIYLRGGKKKHTDDVEVSKMHVPKLQSNLLYSCFIYKFHFIYLFSLIKLYFIYQCIKIQFQTELQICEMGLPKICFYK